MFGNRLKELRKSRKMTQRQLADIVFVDCSSVTKWETGKAYPDYEKQNKLATFFNVSVDYLMGRTSESAPTSTDSIKVPVLGCVAAGIPIEAIEEILDYEELDTKDFNPSYEYFGLRIKGDSMTPRIQDGDVVIVRRQPDIESGEIAIVCINGDEATCKQIKKQPEGITLIPFNPAYDVKFYSNKEIEELPITILGRVMELRSKF